MNEDEPEDLPPFRWNWQALTIAGLTALMLVVPLGGVAYFLQGYLAAPRPAAPTPAPVVNTQPLASALESAANAQLGGERMKLDAEAEMTLTLPAAEIAARAERIAGQARIAGGVALRMPVNAGTTRVVIQVPASRRDLLRRAINGEKIDFAAAPAGGESAILNVALKTP